MTRELEARLKLTASDRTGKALTSVSGKLDGVARKAAAVNRAQTMMARASVAASRAMAAEAAVLARVIAPAAMGYAAQRSYRRFAETDRAITRIGITADASTRQMGDASRAMRTIANDVAMPLDEIRGGLDNLVAAGKTLDESMDLLPAVARTAQASGAAVGDMAATAVSVGDSFRIMAGEMETAFDIMAAGGKAGKFELRDMAQYLPSLAPAFAAIGYEGVEGLTKAVAMLQVVRTQTGEASEAATNMANVLQKMETNETANKFDDFGIDLRREMAKARREGKDLLETFLDLSDEALQGDLSKIPQLFTDAQFGKGMRALLSQRDLLRQIRRDIEATAKGTVGRDLERVVGDSEAGIQRLANAMDSLANSTGRFLASFGVPEGVIATSKMLDDIAAQLDDISRREGGLLSGADGEGVGPFRRGSAASKVWGLDSFGYLGAAGAVQDATSTEPGALYASPGGQTLAEWWASGKDALAGARPTPVPRPAPGRAGDAVHKGAFAMPVARPDMETPGPVIAWDASFALPRARGDGGAAVLPDAAVAAADSLAQVAESGRVVAAMFGDSEALRALLGGAAGAPSEGSGAPSGGPAAPSLQDLDDDALARRLGETREPVRGIGPVSGDATLGSTGSFRGAAEIDAIGEAADDAAGKLGRLPEAMNPAAFGAAAQASGEAFRAGLIGSLDRSLAEAKAKIEQLRATMTFTASPTVNVRVNGTRGPAPVNADRGPSMSELGVP